MKASDVEKELKSYADPTKAKLLQGFFKTGKGEYGEGDVFLGLTVPQSRSVAKKFKDLPLSEITEILQSKYHEVRLVAVLLLVHLYQTGDSAMKKKVYDFYIKNAKKMNNWDFVDLSAHKIVGDYLLDKDKKILYKLVKSSNLWERRISIISTMHFISKNKYDDSIHISEILLEDKHDLIHKAVGWTLREVGKKDVKVLEKFLDKYSKRMPRTMLRYSIEKFSEKKRKHYMKR
ncbi:DNA alkylation repair protein [Candidatus Woesearchaeota archaeon]|nr:DNA alkylation repair protein [Candidatus Woesearchaeota archaeon]